LRPAQQECAFPHITGVVAPARRKERSALHDLAAPLRHAAHQQRPARKIGVCGDKEGDKVAA